MGLTEDERAKRVHELTAKREREAQEKEAVKRRIAEDAAERRARLAGSSAAAAAAAALASTSSSRPSPAGASSGALTQLRVTAEDGRVLRGTFGSEETLGGVRAWAVQQLAAQPAAGQRSPPAAAAPAPSWHPRSAFPGAPRTLSDPTPEQAERTQLLAAARARHVAETERMRADAAALRAPHAPPPSAPAPLIASQLSFVSAFPEHRDFPADDASMALTLRAAGLVPQASLHLCSPRTRGVQAQAVAPIAAFGGGEEEEEEEEEEEVYDDQEDEEMTEEDAAVGQRVGGAPVATQAPGRDALLAAVMARKSQAAVAQGGMSAAASLLAGPTAAMPTAAKRPAAVPARAEPQPSAALAAALARAAAPPPVAPSAAAARLSPAPTRAPPPPPVAAPRSTSSLARSEALRVAAEARASSSARSIQPFPSTHVHATSCLRGANPPNAVHAAQDAQLAAAQAYRATALVRRERVRELLREDRQLRRFDPIMHPLNPAVEAAAPPARVIGGAATAAPPGAAEGSVRVRVVRGDGSALTLRLPVAASLRALRLAALASWHPDNPGTPPGADEYGFLAHGGCELFGDKMALSLAQAGLAGGGGVTLHLVGQAQRGAQARGGVAGRLRRGGAPPQAAPPEGREDEEDEEFEAGEDALGGLGGWHGPGALSYEEALAVAERLGVVAVATPLGVQAGLPQTTLTLSLPAACPICMCDQDTGQTVTALPCAHTMHAECAREWLQRATWCPLCKRSVMGEQGL